MTPTPPKYQHCIHHVYTCTCTCRVRVKFLVANGMKTYIMSDWGQLVHVHVCDMCSYLVRQRVNKYWLSGCLVCKHEYCTGRWIVHHCLLCKHVNVTCHTHMEIHTFTHIHTLQWLNSDTLCPSNTHTTIQGIYGLFTILSSCEHNTTGVTHSDSY